MSEEQRDERAEWERTWEQESALGRFGCAVQNLKEVVRERIREEIAEPILDYLVSPATHLDCFIMILLWAVVALLCSGD